MPLASVLDGAVWINLWSKTSIFGQDLNATSFMNWPSFVYIFDKDVQPAHVDALRGTVIQGMLRQSAIYFPESRTLPPPAAITESLLLFEMIFLTLEISS